MIAKELKIKMIYEKYGSFLLNLSQMSTEIHRSYSTVAKTLSKYSTQQIVEKGLLPKWKIIGGKRLWDITDIVDWIEIIEERN